jgi:hypothetical protein
VRYPLQAIMSADEANWFLDLAGYSRAGRTHRLTDDDGQLVAQYEASAANGLPPASAGFVYATKNESRAPLALDAGQLLFLAQAFAEDVEAGAGAHSARARMLLDDAVACVDAALARIPDDAEAVPRDSIRSAEGLALLASEPGRFRRSRLAAYRAALWSQRSSPPPAHDNPEDQHDDVRRHAHAIAEVIRAQVMPLLEQFAGSSEANIVATLRPRESDYEKVFVDEAVGRARSAYETLWAGDLRLPRPSAAQTDIRCTVAPAGMLTWRSELSEQFPGGYRGIATLLDPHRVWIAWKYLEPGKPSGVSFDGLVWVDDHWAWFPKPYRYLIRGATGSERE